MISASSLPGAVWHKSSYSSNNGGDCIEVADNFPGTIPVRDSKDKHGPALVFEPSAWSSFIAAVQREDFRTV